MRARSRYYTLTLAGTFTNIVHGERKRERERSEHIRGQRIPNTWVISQCGYFVFRRNAPRSLAKSLYRADKLLFRASFLSFSRHENRNEARLSPTSNNDDFSYCRWLLTRQVEFRAGDGFALHVASGRVDELTTFGLKDLCNAKLNFW